MACGPDQINAIFLRQTSLVITPLITNLFEMSLDSGDIPNNWKTAYVCFTNLQKKKRS